jgi:glycosyltransferase involved in cell wall biosynthesis
MRILFVDEKDWVKKVPYTIHYLAEHLVKRGHQVWAIDFDDTWRRSHSLDFYARGRQRQAAKIDPRAAVELVSPGFIKLPALSRISTLATHTWAIARLLRRAKIDCIVTYSITNAAATLALGKLANVPVAFHSIDMLAPLVPHRALERPAELIERELIRRADCVLGLTPVFADRARTLGARQVAVIPNGVNVDALRPDLDTKQLREELGLGNDKVVLFVGTITKHVGLDPFLRHFARIARDGLKLVIVGDDIVTGGRELRRAQAICRELGIADSVIFTGLQPAQRVPLYINLADVCVSPFPPSTFSRYNITMKVFEYMACGKPTVMFSLAGTQSLVPPGTGGVIYVESHAEMCAAIERLLQDAPERAHLGAAGRALVAERFSWDQVTQDLERVLLDLRAGRAGGRGAAVQALAQSPGDTGAAL